MCSPHDSINDSKVCILFPFLKLLLLLHAPTQFWGSVVIPSVWPDEGPNNIPCEDGPSARLIKRRQSYTQLPDHQLPCQDFRRYCYALSPPYPTSTSDSSWISDLRLDNELFLGASVSSISKTTFPTPSKLPNPLSKPASAYTTVPALHKNNGYLKQNKSQKPNRRTRWR